MCLDKPSLMNPYTLAIVNKVNVDNDGLVRKVEIKYKLSGHKKFKFMQRHVTSLALLVKNNNLDVPLLPIDHDEGTAAHLDDAPVEEPDDELDTVPG